MERKMMDSLRAWKENPRRMPLLLDGARQVGKTYTALTFGKEYYKNTVYFNMEDSSEIQAIFERDFNIERLIRELSVKAGATIFPGDTLIIFDEIQACERALTSLKYFCENGPEYHIIAAGSLLSVALKRERFSFPVGKVDRLTLYPLDFEEFLWAVGQKPMAEMIREAYQSFTPMSLHGTALDLYREYLVTGGMPQPVRTFVETRDFNFVLASQKALNDAYITDMAKYAVPQETVRIMAAWGSIPAQLSKENHKFQYRVIRSGARAHDYEMPLQWLEAAGVINRCIRVSEGRVPLTAFADPGAFKIYMADTGLLCSRFDIAANLVLSGDHRMDGFKGALTENYIMQALVTAGIQPYYWTLQQNAELDFVFQDRQVDFIQTDWLLALKGYMEKRG
ncbi:MAG TPA: ATP-binding protein [Candidatus Eisenbergiella stercorigallinarum]|uniref:ATP-binding protein n=1 Tax=Candidatus Eisenbergiella stercorigallinarum TaxID=2838557 RepID=A0A9D2R0W3_9FIRM|nr:ATP-binding protein [Candidatus Eisenbergiella stercorigallinarum]